jgi:hypothetical protein
MAYSQNKCVLEWLSEQQSYWKDNRNKGIVFKSKSNRCLANSNGAEKFDAIFKIIIFFLHEAINILKSGSSLPLHILSIPEVHLHIMRHGISMILWISGPRLFNVGFVGILAVPSHEHHHFLLSHLWIQPPSVDNPIRLCSFNKPRSQLLPHLFELLDMLAALNVHPRNRQNARI